MDDAISRIRGALEAGPVAWRKEVRGTGTHGIAASNWMHYGTTASKTAAKAFEGRVGNGLEGRSTPLYGVCSDDLRALLDERDRLRTATQAALNVLEQLQGGCTDSDDGTVEAITVWCPEIIDELRAALENTNG